MNDISADAIAIDIATRYLDDQSKPDEELYYFAYTIGIRNTGSRPAQLVSRRWLIVDAVGAALAALAGVIYLYDDAGRGLRAPFDLFIETNRSRFRKILKRRR